MGLSNDLRLIGSQLRITVIAAQHLILIVAGRVLLNTSLRANSRDILNVLLLLHLLVQLNREVIFFVSLVEHIEIRWTDFIIISTVIFRSVDALVRVENLCLNKLSK